MDYSPGFAMQVFSLGQIERMRLVLETENDRTGVKSVVVPPAVRDNGGELVDLSPHGNPLVDHGPIKFSSDSSEDCFENGPWSSTSGWWGNIRCGNKFDKAIEFGNLDNTGATENSSIKVASNAWEDLKDHTLTFSLSQ